MVIGVNMNKNILKLHLIKAKRGLKQSNFIPIDFRNKKSLFFCSLYIAVILFSHFVFLFSLIYKNNISSKRNEFEQQKIIITNFDKHKVIFDSFTQKNGTPFAEFSKSVNFEKLDMETIFLSLKEEFRLKEMDFEIVNIVENNGLVDLEVKLQVKFQREKDMTDFVRKMHMKIPSIITLSEINISRIGKVMSRSDFLRMIAKEKKNNISNPRFEATVKMIVTIPSDYVESFNTQN